MLKSINALSDEVGHTKTAVFQHIKQNRGKLKGHIKFIKNKEYLDKHAYLLILKSFNQHPTHSKNNYQEMTIYLMKKSIEDKNNQIHNLNKELQQSQDLQLNSQRALKAMKHELRLANHSQSTYKEHGLFWRLFH